MDQVKEILRQAIKYRFWIVVGIASLLPVIAYFSSGAIADETKKATDDAVGADKQVRGFTSGTIPNAPYKEAVEKQTESLTKDVNASWRELYSRQAPLLRWPEAVDEQFTTWTRKWPEGVAPNVISNTIEDYIRTYPKYVDKVYATFKPFDYEEGEGIVVAPPKDILMRPAPFDPDQLTLPGLGKVWAAQERLWIQNTVLDVIAKVNDKVGAKDWESAAIKQVNAMEVASPAAQDQRSLADAKELVPAEDITDPSKPAEETAEADAGSGSEMMKMMGGMGMMGSSGMSSGGGAQGSAEEVYYLTSDNPEQYRVVPIYLSVLIEQSRIPDLLVEFQNSPMAIQVLEFAMMRPSDRVRKPVKGESPQGFGMGGSSMMSMMMGSGGSSRIMGGMAGMSGMESMMAGGMSGNMEMMKMMGGMGSSGGGYPGMMGGMGSQPARKGELIEKNKNRGKKKDEAKAEEKPYEPKIADPYFNVVELRVYGQARFYMPPPPEEAEPASESDMPADAVAPAEGAAPEGEAAEPKAEQPKAEQPKAEGDADEPKADAPAPDADAEVGEPKAEQPKTEEPKAEAEPRR